MSPYLELDVAVVRARYAQLRAALPLARVYYAVKANPEPEVLAALIAAGGGFDVASIGEITRVLELGANPGSLCHANPVRTPDQVAAAFAVGVRLFVTDSAEDLDVLATHAPGASVLVRLAVDDSGSATPFGGKFGCSEAEAALLLPRAVALGLDGAGLSFHVGSQQSDPRAWSGAIAACARVAASAGVTLRLLDLGGGFPVAYREPVPSLSGYASAISSALARAFPTGPPELAVEPGRFLVAEAGVLHAQVVRVSRRHDGRRWVYLDVGRYGGLAETEGEAIRYRLSTPYDGGPTEPSVLAGPTCDGDDVLYREVQLPTALRAGDPVRLLAAGAYTASYASVGFNGLPPLAVRCTDSAQGSYAAGVDEAARAFSGRHVLAELAEVDAALLDDDVTLQRCLAESLTEAGATVLDVVAHRFEPRGVTVLAMLAESHASIHTWPERGGAFVDVFTCGDAADPERAVALLTERLGARRLGIDTVHRGSTPGQVVEPLADGMRRVWDVSDVLWSGRTAYQDVLIGRTAHGITLFCDDERQSSEASQLVYHEALLVPALLLADQRDSVLVIGSSEGVVSELAVAAGASTVDHVDIDAECVRACAQQLPYGYTTESLAAAERGDGPVRMHYEDGWQYLTDTDRRYDVVVVDLPDERPEDPSAQHNRLYGEEFLRLAASVLRPGGVLVGQAGCATLWRNETLLRSVQRFGAVFPTVLHYGSDEHEWSFLTGAPRPVPDPVDRVVRELATLPYRPSSLDAEALRRGAVLPHAVRRP